VNESTSESNRESPDVRLKTFRDFIYLDVDRVYSLSSQVFEGLIDEVRTSLEGRMESSDSQRGRPLSGSEATESVLESQNRTEIRVLHDHLYNELEDHIVVPSPPWGELDSSGLIKWFNENPYLKVRGPAEIEDFDWMSRFVEAFNELGERIAYAMLSGDEGDLEKALDQMDSMNDPTRRRRAKQTANRKSDKHSRAKQLAKETGLHQDPHLLKSINFFVEVFGNHALDISIVPPDTNALAIRGRLLRQWLRVEPELLRSLYGGYSVTEWTIVGQITHMPGSKPPNGPEIAADDNDPASPSLRDPMRAMFESARAFERLFLESKTRYEIIVQPLAVYREYKVRSTETPNVS
jgi:hypothetical protein